MKNKAEENFEAKRVESLAYETVQHFISNSEKISYGLSGLSLDNKKYLTLTVAEITKICSQMYKKRNLELCLYNLQIYQLRFKKSENETLLKNLLAHKNKHSLLAYLQEKHQLSKEIRSIESSISSLENSISFCQTELNTYKKALDICSEFARRLRFYLSIEE